ncbi:MAG: replicative DNA helicase [Elusimicrobia bacterium]|nr:replicative DNA helicase [Elusimicrobiota bacterium]
MAKDSPQLPPQALEAESAVLGAMLIEPDAVERAMDILGEMDFYQESHRTVFRVMAELASRSAAVDVVTVSEELRKLKRLDELGGMAFLAELQHRVATAAHVEHYARMVKEKAILRELIKASTNIVAACYKEDKPAAELLDDAETSVLRVAQSQSQRDIVEAKDLAHEVLDQIEAAHKAKNAVTGVPSGLRLLDKKTAGFQKSDLILIAARPSQGKTALALNIAAHVVMEVKKPVLLFSLEMSRHAIMQRLIASEARVNLMDIRTGFFQHKHWTQLTNATARLSESPLHVVDMPNLSVLGARSISRQLAARLRREGRELALIIIDYLQLMRGGARSESRQQEVSEISRGLKFLARDLNVPVIALSQLSRRSEDKGRTDNKPVLSDLRESGALEQDADLVAFIHRESYYKRNDPTLEGKALIIIAKQRQGPVGDVDVAFNMNITRFDNAALDDAPAGPSASEVEDTQTTFSD